MDWKLFLVFLIAKVAAKNLHELGAADDGDHLLLETTSGPIQGKILLGLDDKKIRAFLGIPYAEPPTGKLRFSPPVPVRRWSETFDATRNPLACYQHYTKESHETARKWNSVIRRPWTEDCLTLNVWTPDAVEPGSPVMVMFHGSGFLTETHEDLTMYSSATDMILVGFNYRLGAFGFLSLGTKEHPGNLGLMDQQLAMKWLNDNAEIFGGKREAIFISGNGEGDASIGLQVILTNEPGLFRAILACSSTTTSSKIWQTKEKAVEQTHSMSTKLDCPVDNVEDEIECLQNAHPEDIVDAVVHNTESFLPNVDGEFLKEPPIEAMKAGRFQNVTMIVFNADGEGSLMLYDKNKDLFHGPDSELTRGGFREAMKRSGLARKTSELDLIEEWYLNKECLEDGKKIRDAAIDAYTDATFSCYANEFVDYAAANGGLAYKALVSIRNPDLPSWVRFHHQMAFDIISGRVFNPKLNYPKEFRTLTKEMMKTIGHFCNRKAQDVQQMIPRYNTEERPYLVWSDTPEVKNHYRRDECALWMDFLPKLQQHQKQCSLKQ